MRAGSGGKRTQQRRCRQNPSGSATIATRTSDCPVDSSLIDVHEVEDESPVCDRIWALGELCLGQLNWGRPQALPEPLENDSTTVGRTDEETMRPDGTDRQTHGITDRNTRLTRDRSK